MEENKYQDFINFLKELENDRRQALLKETNNPSSPFGSQYGWKNTSIESFLEAMQTWMIDQREFSKEPSWEFFKTILEAGKVYE